MEDKLVAAAQIFSRHMSSLNFEIKLYTSFWMCVIILYKISCLCLKSC